MERVDWWKNFSMQAELEVSGAFIYIGYALPRITRLCNFCVASETPS